mmetsp:Transcript_73741/g.139344  ORF Transcript_73741/g.139344 Transcript_73741/m.139344 type:complete len:103 (+) Transcript_73741:248-556(+)
MAGGGAYRISFDSTVARIVPWSNTDDDDDGGDDTGGNDNGAAGANVGTIGTCRQFGVGSVTSRMRTRSHQGFCRQRDDDDAEDNDEDKDGRENEADGEDDRE